MIVIGDMRTREISGTYGRGCHPCTIFVKENYNGSCWYVVEGSQYVNKTWEYLEEGVDVEDIEDVDAFHWYKGINSMEELEEALDG
jgi:hypothetical protein